VRQKLKIAVTAETQGVGYPYGAGLMMGGSRWPGAKKASVLDGYKWLAAHPEMAQPLSTVRMTSCNLCVCVRCQVHIVLQARICAEIYIVG